MNHTTFAKKLDIKELIVEKCHRHLSHFFDASNGKSNASLAFVKKGTVTLNSKGNQIEIPSGSLFYLPNGAKYNSVWKGNPDIEYYGIHMVAEKHAYAIQHIKEFSTKKKSSFLMKYMPFFLRKNMPMNYVPLECFTTSMGKSFHISKRMTAVLMPDHYLLPLNISRQICRVNSR